MMVRLLLLILMVLLIDYNEPADTGLSPVFLVHPVSIADIDGSTVEFTCTANNTDTVVFRVNDTSATLATIISKGFNQLGATTVDCVTSETLSVSVSSLYNNTDILCRAFGSSNNVDSNTAILTVQGPLSSVVDLSYSFIDSSTINISWSPPFTLPGTDISGYNISVTTDSTTATVFYDDQFTQDINYELLLPTITNSSNVRIIVTVSAYNGLNGEKANVSFYKPSVPDRIPQIDVVVNEDLSLSLRINVYGFSIGERPTTVDVFLYLGGVTLVNTTERITLKEDASSSSILTASTPLTVVENEQYTAVVSYENIAGRFNDNSTMNFTTFSFESVNTNTSKGSVCVECVFSSFSTDSGCTVQLVLTAENITVRNETFNRSNGSTTAGGCITMLIAGQYIVIVRGTDSSVVAVTRTIIVTSVPTTTTTTSSMMSSMDMGSFTADPSPTLVKASSKTSDTVVIIVGVVVPVGGVSTFTVVGIIIVVVVRKQKAKKGGIRDKSSCLSSKNEAAISIVEVDSGARDSFSSTHTKRIVEADSGARDSFSSTHGLLTETELSRKDPDAPTVKEKYTKSKVPSSTTTETMVYAEVSHGKNQPRAATSSAQSVEYGTVDHELTARLNNNNDVCGDTPPALPPRKNSPNNAQPQPTVGELDIALSNLVHWEAFAIRLPGIQQHDVERIKCENVSTIQGQKIALFVKWLHVYPNPSWRSVVWALEAVDENMLANSVTKKYLLEHISSERQEDGSDSNFLWKGEI